MLRCGSREIQERGVPGYQKLQVVDSFVVNLQAAHHHVSMVLFNGVLPDSSLQTPRQTPG